MVKWKMAQHTFWYTKMALNKPTSCRCIWLMCFFREGFSLFFVYMFTGRYIVTKILGFHKTCPRRMIPASLARRCSSAQILTPRNYWWEELILPKFTSPKIFIGPEKWWLEVGRLFCFWHGPFSLDMLIFRGVSNVWNLRTEIWKPLLRRWSELRNHQGFRLVWECWLLDGSVFEHGYRQGMCGLNTSGGRQHGNTCGQWNFGRNLIYNYDMQYIYI